MTHSLIPLLLLILAANGAPVLARKLLASRYDYPLDFGFKLRDQDLLGESKTWRGLLASLVFTSALAGLLGYSWKTGVMLSLCAMAGDVFSSFIKRRLNLQPSSMAPFLDQAPESLLPALVMREQFGLDVTSVMILVGRFIVLE